MLSCGVVVIPSHTPIESDVRNGMLLHIRFYTEENIKWNEKLSNELMYRKRLNKRRKIEYTYDI